VRGAETVSPTTDALERLERTTAPVWLVQCNPRSTDILVSSRTTMPDAWCVRRHTHEIRRGDRIMLWLSGANAGVYAIGEITADVRSGERSAAGRRAPVPQTSLDLFLDLFDRPVRRVDLRRDPRFADESIIRQPFAANPHRVSAPAFAAVLERVAASA
jgi:hypothetical protein